MLDCIRPIFSTYYREFVLEEIMTLQNFQEHDCLNMGMSRKIAHMTMEVIMKKCGVETLYDLVSLRGFKVKIPDKEFYALLYDCLCELCFECAFFDLVGLEINEDGVQMKQE